MADRRTPWDRPPPPDASHTKLTPDLRRRARERAEAAGRRYPNLVDNMWAAQQAPGAKTKPAGTSKKPTSKPRTKTRATRTR